jgi:hypothetical protein
MASQGETYGSARSSETQDGLLVTGLFLFAAVLMLVGGSFHVIQGLAALLDDGFIPSVGNYAYDIDITAWGWMHLVTGTLLVLAGAGLLSGAIWARLLALFIVVASAIINFVYIPYQPLWSLVQLTLCGLVIWALLSYRMTDDDLV